MSDRLRTTLLPLIAAFIWGIAFVAQKGNTVGALTFNAARSLVAFLFVLVVLAVMTRGKWQAKGPASAASAAASAASLQGKASGKGSASATQAKGLAPLAGLLTGSTPQETRAIWLGGACCGLALACATFLQQTGLDADTEAGKAGFLTAMYIVLVPDLGLALKKKAPANVWMAVVVAVVGLYLLCVKEGLAIRPSDLVVLACSFLFAVQILCIDHFSPHCNGVKLSCVQFLVCFIVSAVPALIFEEFSLPALGQSALPILYLGVFSSGVAYTLQIVAQKNANPTVVSLLLSMESVFSVLTGAVLLGEVLSGREYLGCALMAAAVVLAQLPARSAAAPQQQ